MDEQKVKFAWERTPYSTLSHFLTSTKKFWMIHLSLRRNIRAEIVSFDALSLSFAICKECQHNTGFFGKITFGTALIDDIAVGLSLHSLHRIRGMSEASSEAE